MGERMLNTESDIPDTPPPYDSLGGLFQPTPTTLNDDGRIDIDLSSRLSRRLSKLVPPPELVRPESGAQSLSLADHPPPPQLNIVIQVVGSRGDVQPFVALGVALQRKHGHRVRIASHNVFKAFVQDAGLGFYPIGGDPAELMAYIVKNPGLIPSMSSLRAGDISARRAALSEMLEGCWRSCLDVDPQTDEPFVANAIIANPPSFAHVHCAQALGVPLHIMFTMPWSSTRAFPHPLANLKITGDSDLKVANYISYKVVEWMTWQGMGDVVNRWRKQTLDLEEVPYLAGPNLVESLAIPHTYCWSPALVPKPLDWPEHVDVCGFFFREMPVYDPPKDLEAFLRSGPPPVYIGFGSIVLDDSAAMTQMLIDAVDGLSVRAVISRGWGKLGEGMESNERMFFIDDCPHEWLFQHVAAVVHHGGAGTTACGLRNGRPTAIIPFFGDQPFWGAQVASKGAGPKPIHHRALTTARLIEAIAFCLAPSAKEAAYKIMVKMQHETGVDAAVESFHRNLPRDMHCNVLSQHAAVWTIRQNGKTVRLSGEAATSLVAQGAIDSKKLRYFETKTITVDPRRYDPASATVSWMMQTAFGIGARGADIILKPMKELRRPAARSVVQTGSSSGIDRRSQTADPQPSSRPPNDGSGIRLPAHAMTGQMRSRRNSQTSTVLSAQSSPSSVPTDLDKRGTRAALAGAKAIGNVLAFVPKTFLVDLPLSTAEGLRALPERTYDRHCASCSSRRPVTGIASGVNVAYKNFGSGVYQGATSIFKQTYEGKKKEGALGAVKGIGIGVGDLMCKTSAGAVGLIAYPLLGGWRSLHRMANHRARDAVVHARQAEGEWLVSREEKNANETENVTQKFNTLVANVS